VAPFILLSGPDSLRAWASVYFYCVIGVAASLAFFSSPGKAYLKQKLSKRSSNLKSKMPRNASSESLAYQGGAMGLPDDPEGDLDEMVDEVRREMQLRRERGQSMSQGLQEAVQEKMREVREKSAKAN